MAWHPSRVSLLALLPALALLGACDLEDDDAVDGMGDLEDEDLEEDAENDGEDEGEDEDASDDADGEDEGEGEDEDVEDEDEDEDEDEGEDVDEPDPTPAPDAAIPCDPELAWDGYACETDDGQEGRQECLLIDGEEFFTPCSTEEPECIPGDAWDKGCLGEYCTWDGEAFSYHYWSEPDCDTPLVVNFDGGPIEYGPVAAATFDLSSDGSCTNTAWPTAPWLALDRDGDGMIRSGAELFGNATAMASGGQASNGFAALAELDSNLDGKISAADDRFSELVLWNDWDADRVGAYAELQPLSQTTLVSIDLGYTSRLECDATGNCGLERVSFEYRKGDTTAFGEVVDVHLLCQ
jgi:hypothetical protein